MLRVQLLVGLTTLHVVQYSPILSIEVWTDGLQADRLKDVGHIGKVTLDTEILNIQVIFVALGFELMSGT
jgi:hypothetical protein